MEGNPGSENSITMVGTSARQTVAAPANVNVSGRVVLVDVLVEVVDGAVEEVLELVVVDEEVVG